MIFYKSDIVGFVMGVLLNPNGLDNGLTDD